MFVIFVLYGTKEAFRRLSSVPGSRDGSRDGTAPSRPPLLGEHPAECCGTSLAPSPQGQAPPLCRARAPDAFTLVRAFNAHLFLVLSFHLLGESGLMSSHSNNSFILVAGYPAL